MNLSLLVSFIGVAILLTLAPGPDIMYLLTLSLKAGTRKGIQLAAGLSSGPVFHTTLVAIGVAAFIRNSPVAFTIMKYAGAAYLLYLAFNAFRARPEPIHIDTDRNISEESGWKLFKRGILMNIVNPKVLLFFLALLPQFTDESAILPPAMQIMILGFTFSIQAFIIFSIVSFSAGKVRNYLIRYKKFPLIMNRVEGCVLTLIALGMVVM